MCLCTVELNNSVKMLQKSLVSDNCNFLTNKIKEVSFKLHKISPALKTLINFFLKKVQIYAVAFASRSHRQLFYLLWHCPCVLDFIVGNIDVNVTL